MTQKPGKILLSLNLIRNLLLELSNILIVKLKIWSIKQVFRYLQ